MNPQYCLETFEVKDVLKGPEPRTHYNKSSTSQVVLGIRGNIGQNKGIVRSSFDLFYQPYFTLCLTYFFLGGSGPFRKSSAF